MRTLLLVCASATMVALSGQLPAHAQEAVRVARMVEADGTTTLVHEIFIPAPAAEVWHAVSTAEGWMRWAVPLAWPTPDGIEASYDPADQPGSPSTIRQQFVAAIPGRMLAFRTTKTPEGFPEAETYYGVTSIFELWPEGDGTNVRLTAVNYPATPAGQQLADFFLAGNGSTLEELGRSFTLP